MPIFPIHMKQTFSIPAILAAIVYTGFFVVIVIIADRGEGDRWWSFIHDIPYGDKVGHLGLVGALSLFCNLAFAPRGARCLPRSVTRVTFILFMLLSIEEIAQAYLPHRTCDFSDWLADLAGLALGQITASVIRARFMKPQASESESGSANP